MTTAVAVAGPGNTNYPVRIGFAIALSLLLHVALVAIVTGGVTSRLAGILPVFPAPQPPDEAMPERTRLTFVETRPDQESPAAPDAAATYSDRDTRAASPAGADPAEPGPPTLDGAESRTLATETGAPDQGVPGAAAVAVAAPAAPAEAADPVEPAMEPTESMPDPAEPSVDSADGAVSAPPSVAAVPPSTAELPLVPPDPSPAAVEVSAPTAAAPTTAGDGAALPGPHTDLPTVKGRTAEATFTRRGILAHDTLGTVFGAYDKIVFKRIGERWIELVRPHFYGERSGEVAVIFELGLDGELTDARVTEDTSGPALAGFCIKAVRDSAPFPPMPPEVVQATMFESREYQVRFLY